MLDLVAWYKKAEAFTDFFVGVSESEKLDRATDEVAE